MSSGYRCISKLKDQYSPCVRSSVSNWRVYHFHDTGEKARVKQRHPAIVAPLFRSNQIFLKPQTLNTSQDAKGGAINYDRLKFNARNTLIQKPESILTTFFDLYGLNTRFAEAKQFAAKKITLNAMEQACLHFRGWLDKLRGLIN